MFNFTQLSYSPGSRGLLMFADVHRDTNITSDTILFHYQKKKNKIPNVCLALVFSVVLNWVAY